MHLFVLLHWFSSYQSIGVYFYKKLGIIFFFRKIILHSNFAFEGKNWVKHISFPFTKLFSDIQFYLCTRNTCDGGGDKEWVHYIFTNYHFKVSAMMHFVKTFFIRINWLKILYIPSKSWVIFFKNGKCSKKEWGEMKQRSDCPSAAWILRLTVPSLQPPPHCVQYLLQSLQGTFP